MNTSDRTQGEITPLPHQHSRQRGLSLIELLVALGLGVIIVAALSQLFLSISRTNLEMAKTNSQIERARFAMQFLQGDIVHAGYWGGFIPEFDDLTLTDDDSTPLPLDEGVPTDVPKKSADLTSATVCRPFNVATWDEEYRDYLLGIPVEVYGPRDTDTPAGCTVVTDRVDGTDLLIVRHVATCEPGEENCEDYDPVKPYLHFRVSNCLDDGDDRYELDTGPTTLRKLDCDLVANPADRRKFVQNIYYIRDWAYEDADSANGKDGIPTLVRSQFEWDGTDVKQQPAEALVEGIERFRVELGIDRLSQTGEVVVQDSPPPADTKQRLSIDWVNEDIKTTPKNRGDGVPETEFERCLSNVASCTAAELANVVAVKLYILARANELTPGYTDSKSYTLGSAAAETIPFPDNQFKRHVFSTTVRLNNISGRREVPFDPSEVVSP